MRYTINPNYRIESQEVIGHGTVFFIRKEHRDDIVILDKTSKELIEKIMKNSDVDYEKESSSIISRLISDGVIIATSSLGHHPTKPHVDSLSFWLQVTDACNLACSYCYIPSLNSKQIFRSDLFDLLEKKLLSENGLRTVHLKLAGGEPLMAFNKWRSGVAHLKQTLAKKNIDVKLRVITNLTILTDGMLDYIKKNDVDISVSMDGLETYHDINRIYMSTGKGSFETVDKNIKRLKNSGVIPSVMVTVTSENYKGIPSLISYFIKNDITFRLADAKGGYISSDEFTATMTNAYNILKVGIEEGFPVSKRVVISDLRTHYPSSTPCSMGKNAAAIYLDGGVYFCHTEFGKGKPMGYLHEDRSISDIIKGGREKHFGLSDDCNECEYRLICAGGCPLYRVNGKSPMCKSYKKIIKQVFDLYEHE